MRQLTVLLDGVRVEMDVPQCPSGIGWLPDGRLLGIEADEMRDVMSKYARRSSNV
ncbi:gluconolactonase [Caballeronia catudaia]|uniref:Gluconolactonase n=1 Tax=Caballeronia catudaia TaxID=1777136 RepID=A0A158CJ15_9BURK|nr:gluconolactonase [Caballeronia catudaia]